MLFIILLCLSSFVVAYFVSNLTKEEVRGKKRITRISILMLFVFSIFSVIINFRDYLVFSAILLCYSLGTLFWLMNDENKSKSKTELKRKKHK